MLARSAPWLLLVLAACGAAAPAPKQGPARMQFAFFRFHDDHVRLTVDGRTVFDRAVTVHPDNARLGLAAVTQVDLPACSDVVVQSKDQRIARRLCLTPQTRSVVVDAGPPLTVTPRDRYQGAD